MAAALCLLPGSRGDGAPAKKAANPDAAATVVVFNEADPFSANLAAAYADKRGIPFDHLVGLSCPTTEAVSREDYDRTIAEPLRREFAARGWWRMEKEPSGKPGPRVAESSIRFVALMRGIPLKIAPAPGPYPGNDSKSVPRPLNRNEAAVDSELAALGMGTRQISGPITNPYYRNFGRLEDADLPTLLLVCRLDAATPRTVQRMIDDSSLAETTGLWGFAYIDSRSLKGGGLGMGDEWLRRIADDAMRNGIPCVHEDTPEQFSASYPMRHAGLYFGWYAEHVNGPFADEAFRFVPGAVAVHIHSFSARTLREPLRNWCAPLLERGAAATLGNVYEPYLHLTANLDIFEERLRGGFTFAEAAYASQGVLSWMGTVIGDPLYRPFKAWQEKGFRPAGRTIEWAAYRDGVRLWVSKDRSAGEEALQAKGAALKSGVIFEGLGALQVKANDPEAALRSMAQARKFYTNLEDRLRCTLHTVGLLYRVGKKQQALALAREELAARPKSKAAPLFRLIVNKLDPPPRPAASTSASR